MATGDPADDPGWGRVADILLGALLPWRSVSTAGTSGDTNLLVVLRTTFLAFVTADLAFGLTSAFVVEEVDDPVLSTGAAVGGVLAIGLVLQVVASGIRTQLGCGDERELVEGYRSRFFLRIALANVPMLLGVVASYAVGSMAPYLAGVVPAAIGFLRVAPTRANLARDQGTLTAQGCALQLAPLLREAHP